jgi:hypothetical protein
MATAEQEGRVLPIAARLRLPRLAAAVADIDRRARRLRGSVLLRRRFGPVGPAWMSRNVACGMSLILVRREAVRSLVTVAFIHEDSEHYD